MTRVPDSDVHSDIDSFGLGLPSEDFESLQSDPDLLSPQSKTETSSQQESLHPPSLSSSASQVAHDAEIKYKAMGWRGVDEEAEEVLEDDFSVVKKPIPEDELDMTPMVDVTFLLLIFFMVSASFTMQKSLQQPKSDTQDPSQVIADPIQEEVIEITIDQNNNFYITSRDFYEKEAPSEREMRALLKEAKDNSTAEKLITKAHLDSKHSRVITAWDAGMTLRMQLELKTTDQDY